MSLTNKSFPKAIPQAGPRVPLTPDQAAEGLPWQGNSKFETAGVRMLEPVKRRVVESELFSNTDRPPFASSVERGMPPFIRRIPP